MNRLKTIIFLFLSIALVRGCTEKKDWELVWSEEFDYSGSPC